MMWLWLKTCFSSLTGSRLLTKEPVNIKIFYTYKGEVVRLPTAHTCGRQLCFSTGYATQAIFDAKIKQSLDDVRVSASSSHNCGLYNLELS